MTMNLDKMKNFAEKKSAFAELVKKGATNEEQGAAYGDMMDALQNDLTEDIKSQVKAQTEDVLNAQRHDPKMTSEEVKFFNEIKTDVGMKEEILLPETTIDKIFEDLTTEHPLLQMIGLQTTGLRLKILRSDAKGAAVWGKIFDSIKGQLDSAFTEEEATQSKLTAFVVVPNDVKEFGPAWISTYVTTQITEAFAVAMEAAFVKGDGNNKPIGLTRDTKEGVAVTDGAYPEKAVAGTITLADSKTSLQELKDVVKKLSVKENGKKVVAKGKTVLIVEPGTSMDFEAAMTMQNVNGQWVMALPYGLTMVESEFVDTNKVIAFVQGRYDAYVAGGINIKQFDQTLAIEDATLYTAKQFVYGKAVDGNASNVYELKLPTAP